MQPHARNGQFSAKLFRYAACALTITWAQPLHAQHVRSDSAGIRRHYTARNTAIFAGIGVVSFGIIWGLPEDMSKWPKEERKLNHLLESYRSPPIWDQDPFFWNYIVHPVAGAWSYLAERNHRESPLRSFLFSTFTSVAWEYGVEAWVERASAQDLLITSTTGSVLGELSYRLTRRMARGGFNAWERGVLLVVNPVWVAERGFRP